MTQTMYIKITENCNLKCSFCYIKQEQNLIDESIVDQRIAEYNPKEIIFHGGEPLLYPATVLSIAKRHSNLSKSITSNLVLPLTDDRLEILGLCGIATSYSIERFNPEQFDTFRNNVKIAKKLGSVTLLVTLSRKQLQQSPKDLMAIINLIDPDNITIERLYTNDGDLKRLYEETDSYLMKLFDYIVPSKNNLLQQMKYAIYTNTAVFNRHCNTLVKTLNPDGSMCSCPNIYQSANLLKKRKECLLCDLYAYCEGDCLSFQSVCSFPKNTFRKILGE